RGMGSSGWGAGGRARGSSRRAGPPGEGAPGRAHPADPAPVTMKSKVSWSIALLYPPSSAAVHEPDRQFAFSVAGNAPRQKLELGPRPTDSARKVANCPRCCFAKSNQVMRVQIVATARHGAMLPARTRSAPLKPGGSLMKITRIVDL